MEYDDPVAFTALLDANVLHPPGLRDLLVRLGQTGLFRPRWSERILDEMVRSILRRRPDLDANRLTRAASSCAKRCPTVS